MKKNCISTRFLEIIISPKALEAVERLKDGLSVNTLHLTRNELNDIGLCYWYGHIVPLDYEKSVKWYLMSARKKYKGAELNLYRCYRWGTGFTPDMQEALFWLRKAAKHNSASAQSYLAEHYYDGLGVRKNRRYAKLWYAKAIANAFKEESASTLNVLGGRFYQGNYGFKVDKEMAIKCFEKAAELQLSLSIHWLICIYVRDGNKEKAEYWMEKYKKCPNKDKMLTEMIKRMRELIHRQENLEAKTNEIELAFNI